MERPLQKANRQLHLSLIHICIAKWFKPEDLIGKKLGIVCNLAPLSLIHI